MEANSKIVKCCSASIVTPLQNTIAFAFRSCLLEVSSALSCSLSSQDNFGYDLPAVEAAKKKHDAIETDIAAYEERVQALVNISKELETERYHDAKRIDVRKDNILRLWDYLQELLKARRVRLEKNLTLQRIFQEMLYIIGWMDDMKVRRSRRGAPCIIRFVFGRAERRLPLPPGSTPVSRLWETPAGGGGFVAETRSAGERHRSAGGESAERQRCRSQVCQRRQ